MKLQETNENQIVERPFKLMNHLIIKVFIGLGIFTPSLFGQGFLVVNTGTISDGMYISEGYIGTEGYQFTVSAAPVYLLSLGVYNWSGVGLNNSHEIGLWDLQGNLLASTVISAGSNANGFVYSAITPVLLDANQTYVIGASYVGHDSDLIGISSVWNNGSPTYNSAVSFDAVRYGDSMLGLTFPDFTDFPSQLGEFGPNAEIQVVPEPSADMLLGLSAILLCSRRFAMSRVARNESVSSRFIAVEHPAIVSILIPGADWRRKFCRCRL